ncbi:zinc-binding alcohol dehydrogenase family protein [Pseudothauera nasutitermitis]|uniref:alcohol dehydrogenase n=1 Tax=Pseudothauera nasutitermitis TaxID=2565930 RepID=A0A4S4AXD2_9RHOO|nr:zinc-dependent alcohol dehydrogenase family protein [Pseudothauera nasutitermitis]THF64745.1 zinc-binding alcohol dehydrogenase family protein [Pseudothauera nasutitermitis]
MRAMLFEAPGAPLRLAERPVPQPAAGQVLLKVEACGVCRTDLHLVDGELPDPLLPVVPGHEIVGRVAALGPGVSAFCGGQRVGVPWLGWTCGECGYCRAGQENLCDAARFTGYTLDGGYAEYTVADQRYCFALPDAPSAVELAPLLCAGLIGHRALAMAGDARRIGLYGFGAAAHIVAQVLRHQGRPFYAFTRAGDTESQRFARELGAAWAGSGAENPPEPLDAALIFAPAGELVPAALRRVRKGGTVVCAGIHMSDIPAFPYDILWGERVLRSVANLTRADGARFFELAAATPIATHVQPWPLEAAQEALDSLRRGAIQGAAVLVP